MRIVEKCLLLANHFSFVMVMFDFLFRALVVLLPFTTILSIFFQERLGIPGVSLVKEGLIFLMFLTLCTEYMRGRIHFRWTPYDTLISIYMVIMTTVTLGTTGISGLLYGGRYDFEFLILFLIVLHGMVLLPRPISSYVRLFLITAGIALGISMLLKWPLSEDILLYLWYSGNPSAWQFGSSVPIFHGVDGANIRRFQGIFDGPNSMAAFLLLYMGILAYYFRNKKDWYFFIGGALFVLGIFVFYTYSRSALLWLATALWFLCLVSFRTLFRRFPVQMVVFLCLFLGIGGIMAWQYESSLKVIMERWGSTQGHIERMQVGIDRVKDYPLGQGLGSAGPGYRYVQDLSEMPRSQIESLDRYYIPESWYIQQFIEWGILGGLAFVILMMYLFIQIFWTNRVLAGMFLSILIMNFFLHTFESSFFSLSLFSLLGLILGSSYVRRKK